MYALLLLLCLGSVRGTKRYCVACEKQHGSSRWHHGVWCHASFQKWSRMGLPGQPHAGCMVLYKHREEVDCTYHRIAALSFRVDTMAFRDAYVMLSELPGWGVPERLWFLGIVGQLYWTWPIVSAVTLIGRRPYREVCSPVFMAQLLATLVAMYGTLKVRRGWACTRWAGQEPAREPE